MKKSFKALPLSDSPVFNRSLLAMFLCGCLFCVLIIPLIFVFTRSSGFIFYVVISTTPFSIIPFGIVLTVVFGAVNNFLLILLNRFSDGRDFQRYRTAALVGSSCTGLLAIPILLILSSFNLRSIQADVLFIAALVVMIGAANQWAMRRHLSWVEAHLDFEGIAA